MVPMQAITSQITDAMEAQGLTLNRLSAISGVPRVTLSRRMANPDTFTLSEVAAVAGALGLTPVVGMSADTHKVSA